LAGCCPNLVSYDERVSVILDGEVRRVFVDDLRDA